MAPKRIDRGPARRTARGTERRPVLDSPRGLKTYPLRSRPSKVESGIFARPVGPGATVAELVDSLPGILAGADFKACLAALAAARARRRSILLGLGAHVIKVGLAPVILDLVRNGWVQGIALNGAGIIHDYEIAACGRTSEEVGDQIRTGRFGMARETAEFLNGAIKAGARRGLGLGEAVGAALARSALPFRELSLLAGATEAGVPVTVHVAVGTDIIHFHPSADGAAIGRTSLRDFFRFCSLLEGLTGGGVYVNIGSAVVLPEVFLKAVAFARNKGLRLDDFSTAVFDFNRHYRPDQNVVRRPLLGGSGRGYYFMGHHEIMIPLVAAALRGAAPAD